MEIFSVIAIEFRFNLIFLTKNMSSGIPLWWKQKSNYQKNNLQNLGTKKQTKKSWIFKV
jgi:hypothetical protein